MSSAKLQQVPNISFDYWTVPCCIPSTSSTDNSSQVLNEFFMNTSNAWAPTIWQLPLTSQKYTEKQGITTTLSPQTFAIASQNSRRTVVILCNHKGTQTINRYIDRRSIATLHRCLWLKSFQKTKEASKTSHLALLGGIDRHTLENQYRYKHFRNTLIGDIIMFQ